MPKTCILGVVNGDGVQTSGNPFVKLRNTVLNTGNTVVEMLQASESCASYRSNCLSG